LFHFRSVTQKAALRRGGRQIFALIFGYGQAGRFLFPLFFASYRCASGDTLDRKCTANFLSSQVLLRFFSVRGYYMPKYLGYDWYFLAAAVRCGWRDPEFGKNPPFFVEWFFEKRRK